MPFVGGKFGKTEYDSFAFLGFFGSAFVSKVSAWSDRGELGNDDVSIKEGDFPLKWLVSDRYSGSSESGALPSARRIVGHYGGEW